MAQATTINTSIPDEPELPPDDLPPDDNSPPEPNAADLAIEARAREMGWHPLAEYRGPPGKWKPAADFIARGENILPIVRDQNRRLTERVGKLEGEITSLRSTAGEQLQIIKELRDMGQRANQAGYDRAMGEIKAKQRQAVESGDTKAYDQLVEQAEALEGSRSRTNGAHVPPEPPATPAPPAAPARPQVSAAVEAFVSENKWFNNDAFLTRKMIDRHVDVIQEGQIFDEAEQLAEAKSRIMEEFPERFGAAPVPREPARRTPPRRAAVAQPTPAEPSQRPGAAQTTINSIQDPEERKLVRKAFDRLKRQLPETTEAEYMALYADPHADVLTLQQKPRK